MSGEDDTLNKLVYSNGNSKACKKDLPLVGPSSVSPGMMKMQSSKR